jgi:hypothetical protein
LLRKEITYKDFNGVERTEDFYFNLTKSEVIELQMGINGGLSEWLTRIVAAQNGKEIMANFKKIILKAYGEKDLEGRRFIKSPEISEAFSQTLAYDQLFMSLVLNADVAAKFVKSIIPEKVLPDGFGAANVITLPERQEPTN